MTDATATARRDGAIIGTVGAAHFLSHFFQLALPPLFPLMHPEFDVGFAELGLVMTVFYAASGIAQAFAGIVVDRAGARATLLGGLGLLAAAILAAGFAPGYWVLLPLAALAGLGNSVFHPSDLAILSLKVTPARLGRAYGIHAFSGTLGYATAPIVVGGLALAFDWRVALVVAGSLGLAATVAMARTGDLLDTSALRRRAEGEPGGSSPPIRYAALLANPAIMLAFLYFALTAAAGIGVQNFAVSALTQMVPVALETATSALTGYFLGSALGMLAGGALADRTTRHDLVAIAGIVAGAIVFATLAASSPPGWLLPAFLGLAGFAVGTTAPSRDLLVRASTPPGSTGKVFGFTYSGLDLGGALAPALFGLMLDVGRPRGVFLAAAGLLLLAILSVARGWSRQANFMDRNRVPAR